MKLAIQQVVNDQSSLVLFKVRVKTLAKKLGFSTLCIENMQIVASEMLSNQIKYANKTGMVQLWFNDGLDVGINGTAKQTQRQTDNNGCLPLPVTIDLFAMDYGAGINDIKKASQDGFTTSDTMGKGLGSVSRLAHESDLYSLTDKKGWHGVALWGRFYRSEDNKPEHYQVGQFVRSYHDRPQNGDAILVQTSNRQLSYLHLDATGHGLEAEKIINKIKLARLNILQANAHKILSMTEQALQTTTGAAAVALKYNTASGRGEYCAVGDMRVSLLNIQATKPPDLVECEVSPGILGHATRSYHAQEFNLAIGELILSASDGIRRNWTVNDFPNLWHKHPQLICLLLGNNKGRSSDDQSIIAIRRIA